MFFNSACPVREHAQSPPPAAPKPFRFLDLPPEIRNRIASFVLVSDKTIRIRHIQYNRHDPPLPEPMFTLKPRIDIPLPRSPPVDYLFPRTPPLTPPSEQQRALLAGAEEAFKELQSKSRDGHSRLAFLMACRQTYTDHWATYYQENEFWFTPSTWEAFRAKMPEKCLDQIRHLYIRMPYRSTQMHVWRTLSELQNLEKVTVLLAPVELASKLERACCVAGARMCRALRSLKIQRDGITPERNGDNGDNILKRERREDAAVQKSINETLDERWSDGMAREKKGKVRRSSVIRKASSRARVEGQPRRKEKRIKHTRSRLDIPGSPTPDEQSMDEYFEIVNSAEDDDERAEEEQAA